MNWRKNKKKYLTVGLFILISILAIIIFVSAVALLTFAPGAPDDQVNVDVKLLRPANILTEDQALEKVMAVSEVKAWQALFNGPGSTSPTTGGRVAYEINLVDDKYYSILLYEDLTDHTSAFGRYRVDALTGAVQKLSE